MKNPSTQLQKISPAEQAKLALAQAPKLKTGDDAAVANELTKRFDKAQAGMVGILALGIYACEIKDVKLNHGQFGKWLAAHAPKLCRANSVTGSLQPSHALEGYMSMTRAVLEAKKLTVAQYSGMISNTPGGGICAGGKLLTMPVSKVPEPLRELRAGLVDSVAGKTQRQVLMDFKQVEEDDGGNLKAKKGRLKGQGGASAAQRAAAKEAELAAEIEERELWAVELIERINEECDDKHLGEIDNKVANKLLEAFLLGADYLKGLAQRRKSAKQTEGEQ